MKLLIDNALSPKVAMALRAVGHDAVHVGELGLGAAEDPVILERAAQDGRVLVFGRRGLRLASRTPLAESAVRHPHSRANSPQGK